jgi:transcription elongation factor Elf1
VKITCPYCGHNNIEIMGHVPPGKEETECSKCGCHYIYEIKIIQTIIVRGIK